MMFDEKLAEALNFTEEELDANRDGYMTKEQRVRLLSEGKSNVKQFIALALLLAMLSFCFLFGLPVTANDYLIRNSLFVIFGLGIVIFAYSAFSQWVRTKADLRKGSVIIIVGKVETIFDNKSQDAKLILRGQTYYLPHSALNAFQN